MLLQTSDGIFFVGFKLESKVPDEGECKEKIKCWSNRMALVETETVGVKRPLIYKSNTEFILIKLVYLTRGLDKNFN